MGSGNPKPLKDYILTIRQKAAPTAELGLGEVPYAPKQVMYLCADIEALTEDTGFVPSTSFEEGIDKTVAWFETQM